MKGRVSQDLTNVKTCMISVESLVSDHTSTCILRTEPQIHPTAPTFGSPKLSQGSVSVAAPSFPLITSLTWAWVTPVYTSLQSQDFSQSHCSLSEGRKLKLTDYIYCVIWITVILIYIYIYAFSRHFYPKRLSRRYICIVSMCVPWELNPQPLCC